MYDQKLAKMSNSKNDYICRKMDFGKIIPNIMKRSIILISLVSKILSINKSQSKPLNVYERCQNIAKMTTQCMYYV